MKRELLDLLHDWNSQAHHLRMSGQVSEAANLETCARELFDVAMAKEKEREQHQGGIGLKIPKIAFADAATEIWQCLGYCAFHAAHVLVYLQSDALRIPKPDVDKFILTLPPDQQEDTRARFQSDMMTCRAHLAAFFWQLDHIFESLLLALRRGRDENKVDMRTYVLAERFIKKQQSSTIGEEISLYRNASHQVPGIAARWHESNTGKFLFHFLPEPGEEFDRENPPAEIAQTPARKMEEQLHSYFEFVARTCTEVIHWNFSDTWTILVVCPFTFMGDETTVHKDGQYIQTTWEPIYGKRPEKK